MLGGCSAIPAASLIAIAKNDCRADHSRDMKEFYWTVEKDGEAWWITGDTGYGMRVLVILDRDKNIQSHCESHVYDEF
jgi:ABC-type molybdenum transport system ATPase subunit/photorepair protein PhrA